MKPARPAWAELMLAMALALAVPQAAATDLLQAWQAAVTHDKGHAVHSAGYAAAQSRRDQASAMWRPQGGPTASVGLSSHESDRACA